MLDVKSGLDSLIPTQRGYVSLIGSWSQQQGPLARLEGGVKLTPTLGAFAFGQAQPGAFSAGAGMKLTF